MPETTEVSPEFKNLQTQLNKEREKNRQLLRDLLEKDEAGVAVSSLEKKIDLLAKAFIEGGVLAEAEGIDKRFKQLAEERKTTTNALAKRRELVEALDAAGLDISDPRAEEVAKEWNSGNLDAALSKAKALQTTPQGNIDATVAAAVQAALAKAGHVDTGETNAPQPPTLEALGNIDLRKVVSVGELAKLKEQAYAAAEKTLKTRLRS